MTWIFLGSVLLALACDPNWKAVPYRIRNENTFGKQIDFSHVVRWFVRQPRVWVLVFVIGAAMGFRIASGGPSWRDVFALLPLAGWPWIEVAHHKFSLHVGLIPPLKQAHAAHHRNPYDPTLSVAPLWTLVFLFWCCFFAWRYHLLGFQSGLIVGLCLLLTYEFVHFSFHTSYKPRTQLGKRLLMNHRAHHFIDETKHYGLLSEMADKVRHY